MSNKNLSDLFAAARAELAREQTPNAVTMRDAERLVSSMRTVPHVTIRERLTRLLAHFDETSPWFCGNPLRRLGRASAGARFQFCSCFL